ncbi:diphosphomevalonate decarboxylase [Mytilus galloprovincialis]|uniref:Diphosphomevalonate decarboxylase n=1 Tax=Mytilus galloprovincialis TaxID=29158 RepID=A0A8B6CEN3_MYTGA|nr:diphosphomevalonate decarboxylase [Mytilus galloprovincialis]
MQCATCTGPVNIAVIKYWGKRNEKLILPLNSSVSVTLHQNELRTKTTIAASPNFTKDQIWLNGVEEDINNSRLQAVISAVKRRARKRKSDGETNPRLNWKLHIVSENNFPTAAGLASSAAGYGCLVYTLAKLLNVKGELSDIARQGSGSACRSVYGGFVTWDKGTNEDGSDSKARQIAPHTHWPELSVLILVVSDQTKHTSSTAGMQTTVETSELLKQRLSGLQTKEDQMTDAIMNKDFKTFAEITMKESNQLHAYNNIHEDVKVSYTFDAGPNACLFMLDSEVPRFYSLVKHFFLPENGHTTIQGLPITEQTLHTEEIPKFKLSKQNGSVKYVIHTKPGPGPQVLEDPSESLVDDKGWPKLISEKT